MRNVVAGAAACGIVSAGACLAVFAMLSEDQVEGPYDGGDPTIAIFGAPLVAGGAALVIVVLCRIWRGIEGPVRIAHTAMPFALWLLILLGIAGAGGERNNGETGVLWAATAVLAHLLIPLVAGAGPVRRRVIAFFALVVVYVAASGATVAGQHRWRTQKFARVGLPTYLPEVPGYRLTGAYAGRSNLILLLKGASPERIDVWIGRAAEATALCRLGSDERWVLRDADAPSRLAFCLPEGGALVMAPGYPPRDIEGLLPSVRLRRVDPGVLARYPDDGTEREAD